MRELFDQIDFRDVRVQNGSKDQAKLKILEQQLAKHMDDNDFLKDAPVFLAPVQTDLAPGILKALKLKPAQ